MINFLKDEADRCLMCKKPRCKQHCPISTPIPEVIALYKEGKMREAGEMLFENNPLSLICSIVCPHENQCKGNCIRGIKGEPIHFYEIEKEISAEFLFFSLLKISCLYLSASNWAITRCFARTLLSFHTFWAFLIIPEYFSS